MRNSAIETSFDVLIGIFVTMWQQYLIENEWSDSEFCSHLLLCRLVSGEKAVVPFTRFKNVFKSKVRFFQSNEHECCVCGRVTIELQVKLVRTHKGLKSKMIIIICKQF